MEGSAKTKAVPPAPAPPAEPEPAVGVVDVVAEQARVDELTARLEALEALVAENADAVPARVNETLTEAFKGASKPLLEEIEAKIDELSAKAEEIADPELEGIVEAVKWAHAKINALHGGVSRAIGVTIPLPEAPEAAPDGEVEVTGTEKADRLAG